MEKVWSTRENLNTNELWKLEKDGLEILKEIPEVSDIRYFEPGQASEVKTVHKAPAEKIEQVADSWQALIDDANKK